MTVFFRTKMHDRNLTDGSIYAGALFFGLVMVMFNGMAELSMTIEKLPVFYKQRDILLYPAWAYSLPTWVMRIPLSLMDSVVWVVLTYYTIGFAPNPNRFFRHWLLMFVLHQMSLGLFRFIAALGRNMIVANTFGSFALLVIFVLGGFIVSREDIKSWWKWGYWSSPLMYAQNGISVNEFLATRWQKPNDNVGVRLLEGRGIFPHSYWYWLAVGALLGYNVLFNFLYTLALHYLNPLGSHQALISEDEIDEKQSNRTGESTRRQVSKREMQTTSSARVSFSQGPRNEIQASGAASQRRRSGNSTSIDIFEAFDELVLMKRGGQMIYVGPLGRHSQTLVDYFEAIEGVPKITPGYNPATWMLEVSSVGQELRLGVDFAELYRNSSLYQRNQALIKELSQPAPGSKDLYFESQYAQPFPIQTLACLWKQHWSYWRNPQYNAVRFFFTFICSLLFGTIFWRMGHKTGRQQDVLNAMGSMFSAVLFLGVNNASSVQPVVDVERTVFYREKAAGMYSALPYALAQVLIELPYVFVQSVMYGLVVYAMIDFKWTAVKFFWFFFFMFFTFLYFTYYGMMTVALTPNTSIAAIVSSAFYGIWMLFCGFLIIFDKFDSQ